MSHKAQQDYCKEVRARFPLHFRDCRVLDCGSLNINGHNRDLFTDCKYYGLDVGVGSNVDIVGKTHELRSPIPFDTIISTEMLEHDKHWRESLRNMYDLLKSGGLLVLTCAGPGRAEHGTMEHEMESSPLTCQFEDWKDYYRNLSTEDLQSVLGEDCYFQQFEYSSNDAAKDTYFWGIKR